MIIGPPIQTSISACIIALILLFTTIPAPLQAADPFGVEGRPPRALSQGAMFALTLWPLPWIEGLRGSIGNRALVFSSLDGGRVQALVGIDLEANGRWLLRLEAHDSKGRIYVREWPIRVKRRRFAVQRLTLPRQLVELDAETAARVLEEADRLNDLWKTVTPQRHWRGSFLSPAPAASAQEGFGLRRIINGQARSPHSGADYKAPAGSIVRASNAARVALAEELFFGGKALVLDHGLGLYTIYFHLQEALVRLGDTVRKGQEIGRVGATGRATGPHLHFGVRHQGARVDPAALLRLSLR